MPRSYLIVLIATLLNTLGIVFLYVIHRKDSDTFEASSVDCMVRLMRLEGIQSQRSSPVSLSQVTGGQLSRNCDLLSEYDCQMIELSGIVSGDSFPRQS